MRRAAICLAMMMVGDVLLLADLLADHSTSAVTTKQSTN
jgi:hypothetical protein